MRSLGGRTAPTGDLGREQSLAKCVNLSLSLVTRFLCLPTSKHKTLRAHLQNVKWAIVWGGEAKGVHPNAQKMKWSLASSLSTNELEKHWLTTVGVRADSDKDEEKKRGHNPLLKKSIRIKKGFPKTNSESIQVLRRVSLKANDPPS